MNKTYSYFFSNSSTNLLILIIQLLVGIMIARNLGTSGKGLHAFFLLITQSISPVFLFGYISGIQYHIASNKHSIKSLIINNLVVSFILGTLYSVIFNQLKYYGYLGSIGAEINDKIFTLLYLIIPLRFFSLLTINSFKANSKFHLSNFLYLIKSLLTLGLIFLGLNFYENSFRFVVIAITIECLISFIISFISLSRYTILFKINLGQIIENFNYGIKSWLGTLANLGSDKIDQFLISFLLSPHSLGIYSISYTILSLLNFIPQSFAPIFFNRISKGERLDVFRIPRVVFISNLTIGLILVILGKYLITSIYGNEFEDSYRLMLIILPGFLLYSTIRRFIIKYFLGVKEPFLTTKIFNIGAIFAIILYPIFIYWNITGVAIASSIIYIIITIFSCYYFKLMTKFNLGVMFIPKKDDFKL